MEIGLKTSSKAASAAVQVRNFMEFSQNRGLIQRKGDVAVVILVEDVARCQFYQRSNFEQLLRK